MSGGESVSIVVALASLCHLILTVSSCHTTALGRIFSKIVVDAMSGVKAGFADPSDWTDFRT
jgi:hypothetical protein